MMFAGWNKTRAVEICREKGAETTVFPNEDKSRVPVFCVVRRKTQCDSGLTNIMERMTRMEENMIVKDEMMANLQDQVKNELKARDQRISLLEEALGTKTELEEEIAVLRESVDQFRNQPYAIQCASSKVGWERKMNDTTIRYDKARV